MYDSQDFYYFEDRDEEIEDRLVEALKGAKNNLEFMSLANISH